MKKIIAFLILTPFFISCGGNEAENIEPKTEIIENEEVAVLSGPHELQLNNGEKWTIDEGMRTYIDSLNITLNGFSGSDSLAYNELSKDLSRQTKAVIDNCTMKGEAHDELHKWLMPFIALRKTIDPLKDSSYNDEIIKQLIDEISIFHTYFV